MEQHYIGQEIEPRKLEFGTERKALQFSQNSQGNINENIELNEEMVKYINNQTEYVKDQKNNESIANEVSKDQQQNVQQQNKETPTVIEPVPEVKAEDMSI